MSLTQETVEKWLNFLMTTAMSEALTLGLGDDLGASVIHTNSNIPRHLKLSIANNLPEKVQILGQPRPASPTNYHFHIQFVNNQCLVEPPSLTTLPNWDIQTKGDDNGYVSDIYLLSTDTITLDVASKQPNSITVPVRYVDATLKNALVEVLQVAVIVGQNVNVLLDPDPKPISETQTVHLTTFMDASAPSPLVAMLVQSRTILNDGTTRPSPLVLRLVNTSPEPVTFAPPPEQNSPTPTSIELNVDLDETGAWALCKKDEAGSIHVAAPSNWTGDPAGKIGTKQKTWVFHPDYTHTTQIDPNSSLDFSMSGVRTTLPPGFTNLYVVLREFPLYGTQTTVTQIEKSPLIYNTDIGSGLLSQGTTGENQHALILDGNTAADLLVVNQSGRGKSAHFKGGAGVTIENNLALSGNINGVTIDRGVITAAGMISNGEVTVHAKLTANNLTTNGETITTGLTSNADSTVKGGLTVTKWAKVTEKVDAGSITAGEATVNGALTVTKGANITEHVDAGSLTVQKGLLTANNGAKITNQLSASGPVSMFGHFQGRSVNRKYTAATDGIVFAYLLGGDPKRGYCLTFLDGNLNGHWIAKATGGVVQGYGKSAMRSAGSLSFPVPKGGVWAVKIWNAPHNQTGCEARVYWMPIGTSQTAAEHEEPATETLDERNTGTESKKALEPEMHNLVQALEKALKQSFTEEQRTELVEAIKRLI